MQEKTANALILVDLQNDFCAGGSLAVPDGDAVISIANQIQHLFDYVVVSKDWHPSNHMSFASNHRGSQVGELMLVHGIQQVLWPDHCVQHTAGAELHPQLALDRIDHIIHKGTQPALDSYSVFYDNEHLHSTKLAEYLQQKGVKDLYIMGLATDYCVKFSCLDAAKLGFNVHIIEDACRGVELKSGDCAEALAAMLAVGVKKVSLKQILSEL